MRSIRLHSVLEVLLVALGGVAPLALLVASSPASHGNLLLAGILAIVIGWSMNLELEFAIGGEKILFAPFLAPLCLAALCLSPAAAMACTFVGSLWELAASRDRAARRVMVNGGLNAVAVGVTAFLLALVRDGTPDPTTTLAFALAAAALVCAVNLLIGMALVELRERSAARDLLRNSVSVTIFDIALGTVAVALTLPFHSSPIVLGLVLVGLQVATYAAARVSTSENLHRNRSEYLRDVFGRYLPAHVADSLAESGREIRLGGEQREVSVLFCDIRGFTAWSEGVGPEQVVTELNALLGGLSHAVMSNAGTLDKYTGDGLMAFWGAPLDQPDHADRAVAAALSMLARLEDCNRDRERAGQAAFAIGIGVHSGRAVVGNIGHEDRLDYTAIGDTVNTAARLEAATKEVGSVVLLSKGTFDALSAAHRAQCEWIDSVRVKGKAHPIDTYSVRDAAHADAVERWTCAHGGTGCTATRLQTAEAAPSASSGTRPHALPDEGEAAA